MPTRNVSLTKELDQFVSSRVEGGHYANASEVMRTALRLLEREEREYEEKLAALRGRLLKGLPAGLPNRECLSGSERNTACRRSGFVRETCQDCTRG